MTYDEWKAALSNGVLKVNFLKTDGSLREMKCTLMAGFLPKPQMITEDGSEMQKKRLENHDVIAVWDLDNQGWRSFRLDSVVQVENA